MKKRTTLRLICLLLLCTSLLTICSGCVVIGERKPICTINFSNGGEVRIRLYPDKCPNTVNNFIKLCNEGFYDGSPVHRIVEYVLIQMGMPGEDQADVDYYIKGEFTENGHSKGDLTFDEGIVGMARISGSSEKDKAYFNTASTQFFIMLEPKANMDGYYAAFGKVITGMDVVTAISKMDTDASDYPRDEIYIVSARVDCYDYQPSDPKTTDKSKVDIF